MYSLSHYVLVVPIILRLIRTKSTLPEILRSQLELNSPAIHAIMECVDNMPEKVLLLCDGFDELIQPEPINSILNKSLHPQVKVIVTTRPHGIALLRQLGSQAIEGVANILGFNDHQISEYIVLFYRARKNKSQGQRLRNHLRNKKPHFLELARIPIRLEMICIVWSVRENLGEHLVDLYIRFIQYLLDHLEKKRGLERTPEKHIIDKHKALLLRIASLANSWDRFGRLQTVLSYSKLKESLGQYLQDAKDLGCIVKYNPSSYLEESDWMFTHLSLQEFFLAYQLANIEDDKEIKDYTNKISTFGRFQKQKVVLSFLCGLNPDHANKIIQTVVKAITDEQECASLLSYLKDLIPGYKSSSKADIPLPHVVDATKQDASNMQFLFNNDCKERNLHTLIINDITSPVYRNNLMYVKELTISETDQPKPVGDIKRIAASMTSLKAINVKSGDKDSNMRYKELFKYLPKETINKVILQGSTVMKQASNSLGQFINLQYLELSEPSEPIINEICKSVRSCKLLNEVNLHTEGFPSVLQTLGNRIKLNLTVFNCLKERIDEFVRLLGQSEKQQFENSLCDQLQQPGNSPCNKPGQPKNSPCDKPHQILDSLCDKTHHPENSPCDKPEQSENSPCAKHHQPVNRPPQPHHQQINIPNIITLNLYGNNLISAGSSVGMLMLCLPGIQVLNLGDCRIQADTLREMSEVIRREEESRLDIKQLILDNNYHLGGGGVYLQQILNHTPSLVTLDVYNCCISDHDVNKLAESNTINHICRLRLYTYYMKQKESIGHLLYKCYHLQVLCLYDDDIGYSLTLCCIQFNLLPHLRVLSLYRYDLSTSLCDVVYNIESLEALSVADCKMSDIDDLIRCVSSLPSLTHLDIHENYYGSDVLEITKTKQQMSNLHRLNIGPMRDKMGNWINNDEYEGYVSAIREELHQDNPDLLVYCKNENMWEI